MPKIGELFKDFIFPTPFGRQPTFSRFRVGLYLAPHTFGSSGASSFHLHHNIHIARWNARWADLFRMEIALLTLTDSASAYLAKMLAETAANQLSKQPVAARTVLLINKSVLNLLQDRILDVRKTSNGPKLGLRRNQNDATVN